MHYKLNPKRKKSIADKILVLMFLAACLAAAVLPVPETWAAEVFTKDQGLQGSVVGVTAEGVEFETIYGKGAIVIPWADVEKIRSDKEFIILYAEDEEVVGRIWGLENGNLVVGPDPASTTRIPAGQIHRSFRREQYEQSLVERLRARYRYWTANFDLALGYTESTTDAKNLSTVLELRRTRKPYEFFFGGYYWFRSTKESGESRVTDENRLLGGTRLDRDLSDRTFAFGQVSAEYDEVQNLSLRTDPAAGVGYRFVNREKLMIAGRSGPGYVYQRYFGGGTENFFTIFFGGELEAELPHGSKFKLQVAYLPEVSDWKDNYLIRTFADWTLPIIDWLDFKVAVFNIYNNQPEEDTEHNSFTMTAGLSLRF
jgi:putative salt-induced outer membrane protein YdiY